MKIYTKTGDKGETGLFGGGRVPKDNPRIRVYGTLDELNAALGMAGVDLPSTTGKLGARILRVQGELFQLGSELATPPGKKLGSPLVSQEDVHRLESEIDEMEAELEPLKTFILPGGSHVGAVLHLARTIVRRAERELVGLNRTEAQRSEVLEYVNRLSDYLFVCARWANHKQRVSDIPWKPAKV